jgi:phage FluMu protein Com
MKKRSIKEVITDEENLESLTCAAAQDEHFIQQPLTISCGHSLCRSCLVNIDGEKKLDVKCNICKETNIIENLRQVKESIAAKKLFSIYIDDLFPIIQERFDSSLKDLKGLFYLFSC